MSDQQFAIVVYNEVQKLGRNIEQAVVDKVLKRQAKGKPVVGVKLISDEKLKELGADMVDTIEKREKTKLDQVREEVSTEAQKKAKEEAKQEEFEQFVASLSEWVVVNYTSKRDNAKYLLRSTEQWETMKSFIELLKSSKILKTELNYPITPAVPLEYDENVEYSFDEDDLNEDYHENMLNVTVQGDHFVWKQIREACITSQWPDSILAISIHNSISLEDYMETNGLMRAFGGWGKGPSQQEIDMMLRFVAMGLTHADIVNLISLGTLSLCMKVFKHYMTPNKVEKKRDCEPTAPDSPSKRVKVEPTEDEGLLDRTSL